MIATVDRADSLQRFRRSARARSTTRARRFSTAFPAIRSRSKYDATKRDKEFPDVIATFDEGQAVMKMPSGRMYIPFENGWKRRYAK